MSSQSNTKEDLAAGKFGVDLDDVKELIWERELAIIFERKKIKALEAEISKLQAEIIRLQSGRKE